MIIGKEKYEIAKHDVWYDLVGRNLRAIGDTGNLSNRPHDFDFVTEKCTDEEAALLVLGKHCLGIKIYEYIGEI
jgi:hypothetical protein